MKTRNILLSIPFVLYASSSIYSQNKPAYNVAEILKKGELPQSLELKDDLQKYIVTTDHFNSDIFGNFYNKIRIKGKYTRGLPSGNVKWNNVTVANSTNKDADFPEGDPIKYMENFTYKPSANMLNSDKFTSFGENSAYAKNLIWDVLGLEGFAWSAWNELKLNEPYSAKNFNGKIDLAGQGSFENKDVKLTWTGVSEQNGELCAVIDYRTFDNPLEYAEGGLKMKGRSHYWGTIWVSLEDKQIEHAVLFEDVVMEMNLPGQTQKQLVNARREINFVKVI